MIKKVKQNSILLIVFFLIIAGYPWAKAPIVMGAPDKDVTSLVEKIGPALDEIIRTLKNPFLSKLPPPPPKPVPVKVEEPDPEPEVMIKPEPPPPPPPKPVLPDLVLSGTILSKDNPRAIVDGQVLGVGDMIQGVRIMAIMKGELDVLFRGEHFLIRLDKTDKDKKKNKEN